MNLWHLEYSFDTDAKNRMMYGKIYGVWRGNTAEAYAEDFKEEAEPLIKKPWAKLINLSNWKTATPEAIDHIGRLNIWCRKNQMEWAIYIIDNTVTFPVLSKMFDKGKYRDLARTFRSHKEGEKFLADNGYKVRSAAGNFAPPRL